jgi:hypothetical protein
MPESDISFSSGKESQIFPECNFAKFEAGCPKRQLRLFTFFRFDARISLVKRFAAYIFFPLLAMISAANPAAAQQRPLITDDVDITPQGTIELSVGVDFIQNAKFPLSGLRGDMTRVGDIRLRTGFASNVEIQVEGTIQNFLAINSQGPSSIPLRITGNSTNDFDDFTVSAKVKLANETKSLPAGHRSRIFTVT